MSPDQMTGRSKWLSWALRHDPVGAGIVLDGEGWVLVDAVIAAMTAARLPLSRAELELVVATNEKKRFAISADGRSIRASQGHSVKVDLGLMPEVPPAVLYHGTTDRFLPSILKSGLERRERHHVHLSAERTTAAQVGRRHGRLALLAVDAARMHADGHAFYRSANGVWLTDAVPAAYVSDARGVQ